MNMITLVHDLHAQRKGTDSPYATLPTIEVVYNKENLLCVYIC